ncbi:MAG: HPr family phosphocarrier protein [Gemmataceae bacterium]|nr:HPr family phosphocarrier protein [Gemmataceae bacterium]
MDQPKATRTVVVTNPAGIHLRAALMIFKLVQEFSVEIELVVDQQRAKASDMLQVVALGASRGKEVTLEAAGPEAEAAVEALAALFAAGFHEEDS